MTTSSTMSFEVGHVSIPAIEEAAGILGIEPADLTMLMVAHHSQRRAREAAPEVYDALDRGDVTGAASAVLEWLESRR